MQGIEARVRRLCERKKNGRLQVPEWLHLKWCDPKTRQEVTDGFVAAGMDKDGCESDVLLSFLINTCM